VGDVFFHLKWAIEVTHLFKNRSSREHISLAMITRRRSFAEYWKHFVAHFNDVHASGYNSAGSVRIRMKFGVLRVYCLELALTDIGRGLRENKRKFCFCFFCPVNNARLFKNPVSQNFTKFAYKTWIYVRMNPLGKYF